MNITPRHTTPATSTLPLYASMIVADAVGDDGEEFEVVMGLDKGMIAQLKERSLDLSDKELQTTSDYERFGKGSHEEWYASKERTLFSFVHKPDCALAALAWFGPKPLGRKSMKHLSDEEKQQDERLLDSGDWHTIVYRSYAPFRGKGLMKDFVRFTMDTYQNMHPGSKLWAGIFSANPASVGLATALGFSVYEQGSDGRETLMIKE